MSPTTSPGGRWRGWTPTSREPALPVRAQCRRSRGVQRDHGRDRRIAARLPDSDGAGDRTQARPKRHPNAALIHRGGPGVSARFAHRKLPFICAQNNGIPLGSCADSFIASHGSATSRRPTRDPAGSQAPVVAHTNVLELESRPKSYSGCGTQGVPSTTLRVTFGTQSAASQKADAVPAGVISAAINPPARTGTAMRFLRSAPSGSGRLPLGTKA